MKHYIAFISVNEKKVCSEMHEQHPEKAIYQAFGCLEDAGIELMKLTETAFMEVEDEKA